MTSVMNFQITPAPGHIVPPRPRSCESAAPRAVPLLALPPAGVADFSHLPAKGSKVKCHNCDNCVNKQLMEVRNMLVEREVFFQTIYAEAKLQLDQVKDQVDQVKGQVAAFEAKFERYFETFRNKFDK